MTCSVFVGFSCHLGVTKGSRSSLNTWNAWMDENVEIVISIGV